ncbi:hypothetical protein RND81_04G227300 [Saponaria officinalis]|uniref:Myb-like domain-containing protein n=1 Tax=Saponaria officinalis TaxID=3572 RepID=A0AAW1LP47_SAPOF
MSSTKVIFTYKRKRLSSGSGVGNADVCPNFSSDVHTGKDQAAPKESSEKDPMILEGVNLNDTDCSMDYESFPEPSSQHVESNLQEKLQVERSDVCNTREVKHRSTELSDDNNCKASGKNVNTEGTSQETTKASSLNLNSKCALVDGSIPNDLVSLQEEPDSLTKHRFTSHIEVSKSKSKAPLLTFSRRLKKKADAISVPSVSCDETLNKTQAVEKSSTIKVATDDVVVGNMSCQSKENTTSKEFKDSSYLCTSSSADIPTLSQTTEKKRSHDVLVVDTPSVTKQSASALSSIEALGTSNLPKDIGLRSSDGELSSCHEFCKPDEQRVSNQRRTSSGDSQLTSSDCADVKTFVEKAIQPTASSASLDLSRPPTGAFTIDCNVIPESDLPEKESDTAQHSSAIAENREKITHKGYPKSKPLELFGDTDLQVMDSPPGDIARVPNDLHAPAAVENKPKCLQLFSDGQSTNLEPGSIRARRNTVNSLGFNMSQLEQASRKASATVGLSLTMEPMYEGQTSRHGSGMHPFQDHNVGIREFIQNPALMFQHNVFPDTCNTRATALRGNRNISLDRFDPGQTIWSEEELDSLWIGIRRHGRGNWHAMLLDPKLRFAPWRVARDLAVQWDREQCNLFTGQHMPNRRCPKPPDAFVHPRGSLTRDSSETHLSLGDVYARKDGTYFGSNGQNQSHIHVTLASNSFNPMHTSVMIGGDGLGAGPNGYLPHWLRDPSGPSRSFEPSLQTSTMPPTGGPPFARPFPNNYKLPGVVPNGVDGPLKKKQNMTENVIVIDSDASSEETVSDDRDMKN